MLCLTRRTNERIWIDETVCITVVWLRNDKVNLGIDAPKEIVIRRAELPRAANRDAQTGAAKESDATPESPGTKERAGSIDELTQAIQTIQESASENYGVEIRTMAELFAYIRTLKGC